MGAFVDELPTRPDEQKAETCPDCGAPVFPREPGQRTVMLRCPQGHWLDPSRSRRRDGKAR